MLYFYYYNYRSSFNYFNYFDNFDHYICVKGIIVHYIKSNYNIIYL